MATRPTRGLKKGVTMVAPQKRLPLPAVLPVALTVAQTVALRAGGGSLEAA